MMQRKSKKHITATETLLAHWSKFGTIASFHREWVDRHCRYSYYPRKEWVYAEGWTDELVFYVCSGMIARVTYDAQDRRHILSVGLPGMAMLSTEHLYSRTQAEGSIVALRQSCILSIPYAAIKELKATETSLENFIDALNNKKRRQLARLRAVGRIAQPTHRYIHFAERLPELQHILTQMEQEELLGISRRTILRTSYFLLTGKMKR